MTVFRGLLAYPITPADTAGRVDTEALAELVDRLVRDGADGIGLLGSTGLSPFLDRHERRRAVRAAVGVVNGRVPVTVGVGALRTDMAEDLARDAAAEGADGLLLPPISYTPLFADEVSALMRAVAAATALPVCVYDNPATTRFQFEDGLLRALGAVPGITAVKRPAPAEGAADWLNRQRALFPDGFSFGCSVDWHAADALLAGADAWHSVLAGLLPKPCVALVRAARNGDPGELARLGEALAPLWTLFREHGSVRVVYAMAHRMSIAGAVPPRPILPLAGASLSRIASALERIGA